MRLVIYSRNRGLYLGNGKWFQDTGVNRHEAAVPSFANESEVQVELNQHPCTDTIELMQVPPDRPDDGVSMELAIRAVVQSGLV